MVFFFRGSHGRYRADARDLLNPIYFSLYYVGKPEELDSRFDPPWICRTGVFCIFFSYPLSTDVLTQVSVVELVVNDLSHLR